MARFATAADLAAYLGVTIAGDDVARAELLLDDASAEVQDAAGQTIAAVTGDVVVLRGDWGSVLQLPERPVTAVDAVTVRDAAGITTVLAENVDYVWDRLGRLQRVSVTSRVPNPSAGWWGGPNATVTVTYSHGWDDVPQLIRRITRAAAARAWVNPEGARSKTFDGYGAVLSAPELTRAERRALRKFRP